MSGKTTTTPTKSTTTTTQSLSPEQQRLLGIAIPIAEQFGKNPPQLFPGSTVSPIDPLQTQGQNMALSAAGGAIPQLNTQATDALGGLLKGGMFPGGGPMGDALSFLMGPVLDPSSNPHLQGAINAAIDPVRKEFTQSVLPNIRSGAISSGQFGGSRQGIAEGNASSDFLRQVGDISSTIASRGYETGLGALVSGLGIGTQAETQQGAIQANTLLNSLNMIPSLQQSLLAPGQITEQVGAQRRAEEQTLLSEQAQRFMAEQLIPFSVAQDIAALAFGIPAGSTTATSKGSVVTQQPGFGQQLLGGAAGLASILAFL